MIIPKLRQHLKVSRGLMTLVLAGCGSAASLSGHNSSSATGNAQSPAGNSATANASAASGTESGGTFSLTEPTTSSPDVNKIRVIVMEQGCTASGPHAGAGFPGGRGQHHRHRHGGGQWQGNPSTMAPPPPSATPTPAPAAGLADGQPSGGGCIVAKDVENNYQAGSQLQVTGIPDGQYNVMVMLEDSSSNSLEEGSATVQIVSGQIATADITLAPVTQPGSGSVNITIHEAVGPAAKLGFVGTALSEVLNTCGALQIQAQDASGNAAPVAVALSLTLTSSATTGGFYSDSACSTAITSVSLAAGASEGSIYYKDSAAGTPTLTATDPSATPLTDATMAATITAQ